LKAYRTPEGDKIVEVVVEIGGKFLDPVKLQVREPEPEVGKAGFAFAVFALNAPYHSATVEQWQMVAKAAISRYLGQLGGQPQGEIRPEYTQPLNMFAEFK
jgi:hypothetical protein